MPAAAFKEGDTVLHPSEFKGLSCRGKVIAVDYIEGNWVYTVQHTAGSQYESGRYYASHLRLIKGA